MPSKRLAAVSVMFRVGAIIGAGLTRIMSCSITAIGIPSSSGIAISANRVQYTRSLGELLVFAFESQVASHKLQVAGAMKSMVLIEFNVSCDLRLATAYPP